MLYLNGYGVKKVSCHLSLVDLINLAQSVEAVDAPWQTCATYLEKET